MLHASLNFFEGIECVVDRRCFFLRLCSVAFSFARHANVRSCETCEKTIRDESEDPRYKTTRERAYYMQRINKVTKYIC